MARKKKATTEPTKKTIDYAKALKDLGVGLTNDIGDFKSPYYLKTGMFAVDFILGDEPGIPVGVTQFYGGENSGKTTAALQVLVAAQKQGLNCFYFNQERSINQSLINCFPELDHEKVNWVTPPYGEECLEGIKYVLRNVPNSFVVLDSIPACHPKKVLESETGTRHMAPLATIFTPFMADVKNLCYANNSVLLLINQQRAKIDPYQQGDTLVGGKAIGHNCDLIVRFKVRGKQTNSAGEVVGHTVEAETMKNRFQGKGKKETATLMYGKGFSESFDILDQAVQFGIINKSGSWLTVGEEKVQGVFAALDYLDSNPEVLENIRESVMEIKKELS